MPTFENEDLVLKFNGEVIARIDVSTGNLTIGGQGRDGDILVKDSNGDTRIQLSGDQGQLFLGTDGRDGNLIVRDRDGRHTVFVDGDKGLIRIGTNGQDGDIEMMNDVGARTVHIDGRHGNGWFGGNGSDGDLVLFPSGVTDTNDTNQSTIHLDGEAGDIILRNADAAEDFDVAGEGIEAGSVLVIDEEGQLRLSSMPYDRRVAGVVSGGGCYRPGIILDRQPNAPDRRPIALAGKVHVKADARRGRIGVGDLLTTADEPGHAMRADDSVRAFGAVIGKALAPLHDGLGSVPILVSLQ